MRTCTCISVHATARQSHDQTSSSAHDTTVCFRKFLTEQGWLLVPDRITQSPRPPRPLFILSYTDSSCCRWLEEAKPAHPPLFWLSCNDAPGHKWAWVLVITLTIAICNYARRRSWTIIFFLLASSLFSLLPLVLLPFSLLFNMLSAVPLRILLWHRQGDLLVKYHCSFRRQARLLVSAPVQYTIHVKCTKGHNSFLHRGPCLLWCLVSGDG